MCFDELRPGPKLMIYNYCYIRWKQYTTYSYAIEKQLRKQKVQSREISSIENGNGKV